MNRAANLGIFLTMIFFVGIVSFDVKGNEQKNLTSILQASFGEIYLAKHGLEYPYTEDHLNRCIKLKDKPCLEVYNRVEEGKKTITSLPASKALDSTLDIIETACLSNNENMANFTCYGGVMSLYFYASLEQDALILARIKKYPKKVRNLIFNHDFFWYYNRPDFKPWVSYISETDIDWEHDIQKQTVLEKFKANVSDLNEKLWVLGNDVHKPSSVSKEGF